MTRDSQVFLRVGLVIGLRAEAIAEYRRLHDGPGVRDLLRSVGIRNFSIFLQRLPDGLDYEFAYFEYHGQDLAADLRTLAEMPRYRAWLAACDPLQRPLPGHPSWCEMTAIYCNP